MFQALTRSQMDLRVRDQAVQLKQSSPPPTKCRNEWHENVYIISNAALIQRMIEPRPMPQPVEAGWPSITEFVL